MKKVKVIFPDGSTADIDESKVDQAISAGAKRFEDKSPEASQKSTSMVFPDGSIADVPNSAIDIATENGAIKKKVGGNGTIEDVNTTIQKSVPTTLQSGSQVNGNDYTFNPLEHITNTTPTVVTNDGIQFPVVHPTPFGNTPEAIQGLQQRVTNKTATDDDINILAQSSGKSVDATKAYLIGGQLAGGSIENVENVNKTKDKLSTYINNYNTIYGTQYDPNDVLSSSQKAFDFLELAKNTPATAPTVRNPNQVVSENTAVQRPNFTALLPTDISNEMINQVVSKTVAEDMTNSVPREQTVVKIAQRLNPKEFARVNNVQNAEPTLYDKTPLALIGNLFRNNTNEDELLNSQKGIAEVQYNQALKQNSINKISEGVINGDNNLITQGQHELSQVDDNAIYKYPSLIKQQIAQRVNDEIARESGVVVGSETVEGGGMERAFGASTGDRLAAMKRLGYLDDPRTKDIAEDMASNSTYFANNSILGSAVPSFLQPFADLGMSIGDILSIRNSKDLLSEDTKSKLYQTDFSQNGPEGLQLNKDVRIARNIVNTTFNLGGMLAISTATEGIAGSLGASASLAQKLGAYTSFGLPSFDASLKDSKNFIESVPEQYMYATFNSIANAEGGRLLDLGKITRIPGVSDDFARLAKGISDKTITEQGAKELLEGGKNKYIDFAVKYGKNVTKGAATMAYFTTSNSILKMAFGDPNTEAVDILPQAGHAFLDGVLGMSIMGGFGAVSDMRNEKNTTYKGTIYNMAINHDAAKDVFDIGLKNGEYDKEAYDNKIAILNTAVSAKGFLDLQESQSNVNLTQDQKAVYVSNKTAENTLREKANNSTLPEDKGKYEKQADQLKIQSNQILEGLKFNSTLQPLQDQFEAGKVYDTALENYNPDNPASVTELETAKKNLDATTDTKLSEPIAGLDAQGVPIKTDNINSDFNAAQPFIITPEARKDVGDIVTRINNAEYINEKDLDQAANHLYDLLDKHGDNQSFSNLIEPLINKIEGYDFRTKTENSTVTETVPTEVVRPIVERKEVNKSISQWEGNRATITDENGKTVEGVINLQDGKYYLHNDKGEKVAAIGDTAITDAHITLPDTEKVPAPIQFDDNGDIKSMTLQINKVDKEKGGTIPDKLITINFRDKEKALDYAIQLRAEQVGEYPQPKFDLAYEQIQKEIQQEVPVNDLSTKPTDNATNTQTNIENKQGNVQTETTQPAETITTENSQPTETFTENEQAAIDAIKSKDFTGSIKNWTDVIKDDNAPIADRKQALKELTEQLTDPNSEVATGTALGKDVSDAIYNLENKNEPTTGKTTEPIPTNESGQKEQGSKETVPPDTNETGTTDAGTAATVPPVEPPKENVNTQSNNPEGIGISKEAVFEKFGKSFEKTKIGWNDVTKNAVNRLREDAESKNTTVDQEAAFQVGKMADEIKNNRLSVSEDRITTATLHLINVEENIDNLQNQKANTPEERAALAIALDTAIGERDLTLKVIDALGSKSGRNLGLFAGFFSKNDDGGITVTRRRIEGTLGMEVPETIAALDANEKMSPWQKERVRPYVKKIEEIKAEYDKKIAELNSKKTSTTKTDTTQKERNKASKSIRDFANKVRGSETLDKLGLGKARGGEGAKISGFTLNVKKLLADALDYIADAVDKGVELSKAIGDAVAKFKGKNDGKEFSNLVNMAVGKLPEVDQTFRIGDANTPQTFDVKSDVLNEDIEIQRRKTIGQLNQLSHQAEESNRKWYSKALDWRRSFLIGGLKTIGRVFTSGISKFVIDPISKQTTGRITSLLPGLGKEKVSAKSAIEGVQSLIKFKDNGSALKYISGKQKLLEEASNNLDKSENRLKLIANKYGKNSNEFQKYQLTEHRKIQQEYQQAELEYGKSSIYKWINGNGFKDAKDLIKYGSTDFEQAMGGYGKIDTGIMGKSDKILYYIESINRTHAVLKNPSARRALVETYNSKLENYQKEGIPLTASTRMRALDMAYGEFLSGKYQEKTQLVDYVNKAKSQGEKEKSTSVEKAISTFLRVALPVAKVPVNIVKTGFDMSTVGVEGIVKYMYEINKGVKLNAEQGKEYKNVFDKISQAAQNIPEKEKNYINKVLSRGLFGLGLMLTAGYGVSNGTIQYGGQFDPDHKAKRKFKDKNGDWKTLDYGEWVIGGDSIGKFGSSILNHLPEFLPVAMVVNTHDVYDYEHDYIGVTGKKKLKDNEDSYYEALKSDVNEIAERLPYKNLLEPAQLARSLVSIQLFKDISEYFDKDKNGELVERKPSGIIQTFEMNTGLRKLVDLKPKK